MKNRSTVALGETYVSVANVMATSNTTVRFWIITMLLGLAALKLR